MKAWNTFAGTVAGCGFRQIKTVFHARSTLFNFESDCNRLADDESGSPAYDNSNYYDKSLLFSKS